MNEETVVYEEDGVISVDNTDYVIVDKLFYSGKQYLFIADVSNPENNHYMEETEGALVEVTDENEISVLAELIIKKHNLQDLTEE